MRAIEFYRARGVWKRDRCEDLPLMLFRCSSHELLASPAFPNTACPILHKRLLRRLKTEMFVLQKWKLKTHNVSDRRKHIKKCMFSIETKMHAIVRKSKSDI